MNRKDAFGMITADLKLVKDLDLQKVVMLAQFLHSVVENKGAAVDEDGVCLIKESSAAVFEKKDPNLVHALIEVHRAVARAVFNIRRESILDRKTGK